ncbi:MAG: carbohydrate ABC transporter permease [Eubacteriales bacterium]|nr:carbohydrate ABC transporter permease [Eubacteriales bacterium]
MKHHSFRLSALSIRLMLIFLALLCAVPFLVVFINSSHSSLDIIQKFNLLPGDSIADNYKTMQSLVDIWRGFFNSIVISVPYTLLTGYFGAMIAYGFAKFNFRSKNALYAIVLASMMIPSQLSIIGFYRLCLNLHMTNSYLPFIIPGIANATTVFFLRGIIEQSISDSMIEAPRIEGCSEFGIFNRIVLPCIMPGVATMCIFNFVASWNAYMGPLIILQRKELYTMPVMISMIKGLYVTNYGAMYLAIAISVIPIMIVFAFFSRYIIDGLTTGSEK